MRTVIVFALAAALQAGTFGTVVVIPGQAADIALDEARGVLYVANFTAGRIEVMRTSDAALVDSMGVAAYPSSLALSRDGRYLLAAHFGNFAQAANLLTLIQLDTNARQTLHLGAAPLGAAFGADGRALVVTASEFLLFEPATGALRRLASVPEVIATTLPQPPPKFPPEIVAAAVASSADGSVIWGLTDTFRFTYDIRSASVRSLGYTSTPALGPRVVSVAGNGALFAGGWGVWHPNGMMLAQFPNPSGLLNVGSHAIDGPRNTMYAQVPEAGAASAAPVLQVLDADNLTVRERLYLPENLAGRGVLSSDGSVMYAVSESGVTVLPVGALNRAPRLRLSHEDLLFRGSFCERGLLSQDVTITDPGGGRVDFALRASGPGILLSAASGATPARVRVSVDPTAFRNQHGTTALSIAVTSNAAVNAVAPLRVLVNNREPDQRGTIVNVPGDLVDVLADPARDRFYVLRQDRNEVLVFDGANHQQIATLRTGNTPTQLAITFDRSRLLVAADNSQIAHVYDLDTLRAEQPVRFPPGHYPRSIACASRGCLAAVRNAADPDPKIDRIDLAARIATELPSLGPWENKVHADTRLAASEDGVSILAAQPDGAVLIYDANADTFIAARKDLGAISGTYAAWPGGFLAGDALLNAAGVPVHRFTDGTTAGFAVAGRTAFRASAASLESPGAIERVDLHSFAAIRPTRTSEAPCLPDARRPLMRTLAPLAGGASIVVLGVSGFTVLPWTYEASVPAPRIDAVVNAADFRAQIAPGSLITLWGRDLSPVNLATSEMPLPTALAESCLIVNGALAPLVFVSPGQVNAQLPYPVEGRASLVLHTPGGVSNSFTAAVEPAAPGIFTVLRLRNGEPVTPSNPIHLNEDVTILATGLGPTFPAVEAGAPAPADPPARVEDTPAVELGGVALPLYWAGLSPGTAGVYQILVRVPGYVPRGWDLPLTVRQGGASATVPVRVID